MYKQFLFEGDIHEALECVPLAVRRKLDLALLKISLAGWQALPRTARLELCHLAVGTEPELLAYREFMRKACRDAGVPLKALDDPNATARTWNAPVVPAAVELRTSALGVALSDRAWCALDEEIRYALLKLADPKRNPLKLQALLVELGLLPGPLPVIRPQTVVCEAEGEREWSSI